MTSSSSRSSNPKSNLKTRNLPRAHLLKKINPQPPPKKKTKPQPAGVPPAVDPTNNPPQHPPQRSLTNLLHRSSHHPLRSPRNLRRLHRHPRRLRRRLRRLCHPLRRLRRLQRKWKSLRLVRWLTRLRWGRRMMISVRVLTGRARSVGGSILCFRRTGRIRIAVIVSGGLGGC